MLTLSYKLHFLKKVIFVSYFLSHEFIFLMDISISLFHFYYVFLA